MYETQNYSDGVISKFVDATYYTMNPNSKLVHALSLQQNSLTSEEKFAFGDIFPRSETFYTMFDDGRRVDVGADTIGGYQIVMSLD